MGWFARGLRINVRVKANLDGRALILTALQSTCDSGHRVAYMLCDSSRTFGRLSLVLAADKVFASGADWIYAAKLLAKSPHYMIASVSASYLAES